MTRLRWTAGRDGRDHAHIGVRPRTLCGIEAIDPVYAWPTLTRCPRCVAQVKETTP